MRAFSPPSRGHEEPPAMNPAMMKTRTISKGARRLLTLRELQRETKRPEHVVRSGDESSVLRTLERSTQAATPTARYSN